MEWRVSGPLLGFECGPSARCGVAILRCPGSPFNLTLEATDSSEICVPDRQTTRRHIPEDLSYYLAP